MPISFGGSLRDQRPGDGNQYQPNAVRDEQRVAGAVNRRAFMTAIGGAACMTHSPWLLAAAGGADAAAASVNLARVATPSSKTVTSENKISALNDGVVPRNSADREAGTFAIRETVSGDDSGNWVEYAWSMPVTTDHVELYWAVDAPRPDAPPGSGFVPMNSPASYRILYWDGQSFAPVKEARGYGIAADAFNRTTFHAGDDEPVTHGGRQQGLRRHGHSGVAGDERRCSARDRTCGEGWAGPVGGDGCPHVPGGHRRLSARHAVERNSLDETEWPWTGFLC